MSTMATPVPNTTLVLITGANSGIGFATAEALASAPHKYHVLMGYRNPKKGVPAVQTLMKMGLSVEGVTIDVADDNSINAAASYVASKYGRLDILINNAGHVLEKAPHGHPITRDEFHKTMDTNVFGAAMTTEAFLPLLKQSLHPRIIFVTSSLGSLSIKKEGVNPSSQREFPMYRSSKAAMNMMCLHYADAYKDWKINTCDPGLVRTNLSGYLPDPHPRLAEPDIGCRNVVRLATLGKDGETGTFSSRDGPLPW